MAKRSIIRIDEEKCNGCGLCIPNCKEGALQMIDGKARLVSDVFCDGLGVCLGHCPEGAISIEEREAEPFDEKKVMAHKTLPCGCPGTNVVDFRKSDKGGQFSGHKIRPCRELSPGMVRESQLGQWPVQIMLVPAFAPYLNGSDLLIAADCVPFAYASFHEDFLKDKTVLVGCPKLDDIEAYKVKFTEILKNNDIKSITYVRMEVPCCAGMTGAIKTAIAGSGKNVTFSEHIVSIKGERLT